MIVKLKVKYHTRGREIVTIKARATKWQKEQGYAFRGQTESGKVFTYTQDGFFYRDKSTDSLDLIREVR